MLSISEGPYGARSGSSAGTAEASGVGERRS